MGQQIIIQTVTHNTHARKSIQIQPLCLYVCAYVRACVLCTCVNGVSVDKHNRCVDKDPLADPGVVL